MEDLPGRSFGWAIQRLSFLTLGLSFSSLFFSPLTPATLSISARGVRRLVGIISVSQ